MKEITIKEVFNGYRITVTDIDSKKEYVYRSVDVLQMVEFIGRLFYGRKVRVEEK